MYIKSPQNNNDGQWGILIARDSHLVRVHDSVRQQDEKKD